MTRSAWDFASLGLMGAVSQCLPPPLPASLSSAQRALYLQSLNTFRERALGLARWYATKTTRGPARSAVEASVNGGGNAFRPSICVAAVAQRAKVALQCCAATEANHWHFSLCRSFPALRQHRGPPFHHSFPAHLGMGQHCGPPSIIVSCAPWSGAASRPPSTTPVLHTAASRPSICDSFPAHLGMGQHRGPEHCFLKNAWRHKGCQRTDNNGLL